MCIKRETININVRVKIEYDKNNPESRKRAIKTAIDDVTGIKTYGYPISVFPLSAKVIKPRKKIKLKK